MQRQLTWWASDQPPSAAQPIWAEMDKTEQIKVIAALARLIVQAIRAQNSNTRKEDEHEQ
jgi:hypothetical protein